ncbi:DNA-binding protein [Streptomyces sp. NPDC004539]|uniref:DNA-binding protein n=1 Tax=Streptomyces sp. NPDC004539 TaxID=3154280 RepID=UPI0033AFEA89
MPTPFRHTVPPSPRAAEGRVAEAYAQIARDLGTAAPAAFVVLSSAPEVMLPAWALLRESLIAGPGDRTGKEVAAYGVALADECRFTADAHAVLLHATGDHALAERLARGEHPENELHARVLDWAGRTRVPGAALGPLPFPDDALPGYLGTVLASHFADRVVSALLTEHLLPAGAQRLRPVRSLTGRTLSRAVLRGAAVPGASLPLLQHPGEGPAWAAGTPVGPAYDALRTAALEGGALLDEGERCLVRDRVAAWDGARPPVILRGYPHRRELPGARLALLAALAPHRITEEDVEVWRADGRTDRSLVRLVAYGAFLVVERIASALHPSPPAARHI